MQLKQRKSLKEILIFTVSLKKQKNHEIKNSKKICLTAKNNTN